MFPLSASERNFSVLQTVKLMRQIEGDEHRGKEADYKNTEKPNTDYDLLIHRSPKEKHTGPPRAVNTGR